MRRVEEEELLDPGGEGIDPDPQGAAGSEHPPHFAKDGRRIGDVVERIETNDVIEGVVGEGQLLGGQADDGDGPGSLAGSD